MITQKDAEKIIVGLSFIKHNELESLQTLIKEKRNEE